MKTDVGTRNDRRRTGTGRILGLVLLTLILSMSGAASPTVRGIDLERSIRSRCAAALLDRIVSVEWVETPEQIGSLVWSGSTLQSTHPRTFSEQLDLVGTMDPDGTLYVGSFLMEQGELRLWERTAFPIGSSGLVDLQLSLPQVGEQVLFVITNEHGKYCGCVYTVTRCSRELEEALTGMRINLFEEHAP